MHFQRSLFKKYINALSTVSQGFYLHFKNLKKTPQHLNKIQISGTQTINLAFPKKSGYKHTETLFRYESENIVIIAVDCNTVGIVLILFKGKKILPYTCSDKPSIEKLIMTCHISLCFNSDDRLYCISMGFHFFHFKVPTLCTKCHRYNKTEEFF